MPPASLSARCLSELRRSATSGLAARLIWTLSIPVPRRGLPLRQVSPVARGLAPRSTRPTGAPTCIPSADFPEVARLQIRQHSIQNLDRRTSDAHFPNPKGLGNRPDRKNPSSQHHKARRSTDRPPGARPEHAADSDRSDDCLLLGVTPTTAVAHPVLAMVRMTSVPPTTCKQARSSSSIKRVKVGARATGTDAAMISIRTFRWSGA